MGEKTGIAWAHSTFNPWWGCARVSEGCTNCYAERVARRFRPKRQLWGSANVREIASDESWEKPLVWNAAAERAGERRRVFCASMADVFEDVRELDEPRRRLARLIVNTPSLDWLLLTKRPEHVMRLAGNAAMFDGRRFRPNVWLGVSVENRRRAEERLPLLLELPADARFVSLEPLLESVDVRPWLGEDLVSWVIVGGESGPEARPMHPMWATFLRDQARAAGVAFFFKQWGAWRPILPCYPPEGAVDEDGCEIDVASEVLCWDHKEVVALEPSGSIAMHSWPDGHTLDDRQPCAESWWLARTGAKEAGCLLQGQTIQEVPHGAAKR